MASVVSGAALGWCFSEPAGRWLAWIALVPFAWTLTITWRPGLYLGVLAGAIICHLFGLECFRVVYAGSVESAWITVSILASLPWVAAAIAGRWLVRQFALPMGIALPLIWVPMEFARMHFMALFVEVPFPYLQLGSLLVEWPRLIQAADIGGVYILSWIVAAVNGASFDALQMLFPRANNTTKRTALLVGLSSSLVLLVGTWLYGGWRLSQRCQSGPLVALVPGGVTSVLEAGGVAELTRNVQQLANGEHVALFVWAETTCPAPILTRVPVADEAEPARGSNGRYGLHEEDDVVSRMEKLSEQLGAAVIAGCRRHEIVRGEAVLRRYNSLAMISPARGFQGCHDKVYLVPWREFQPRVALNLGLLPAPPSDPAYAGPFHRGTRCSTFTLTDAGHTYQLACSICFEVAYAALHRRLMRCSDRRPDFFVGAADESAFAGSQYAQLSVDAQRMRAIECRRAFVRIAKNGLSSFVDGNGEILTMQHCSDDSEFLIGQVPIDRRVSPYVVCGDWLPIVSCIFWAILGLVAFARRRWLP
ncbi:MAG: hypothetical protein WD063_02020 [Pirellulales bacterium]